MGYHLSQIPQGEYGELSKVQEEITEALDAEAQKNPVMVLIELADIVGAIEGYLETHHPTISMTDLVKMAAATRRAFQTGARK